MISENTRSYSCKDEELPAIGRIVANNYRRDHAEFEEHSPLYNETFISGFEQTTIEIEELIDPKSETLLKKVITDRMHATMTGLLIPIDHLEDYVRKGGKELPITPANFGIVSLRSSIRSLDAEGVTNGLTTVLQNVANHKALLIAKGLTDVKVQTLKDAQSSIRADKTQQSEISSHRRIVVQENLGKFNDYYVTMKDILDSGKSLYRRSDPAKIKDYTFTELLKRVQISRASKAKTDTNGSAGTEPAK